MAQPGALLVDDDFVVVGKITGVFGVRGGLKVYSYTEPHANILNYSPWYLITGGARVTREVRNGHAKGKGVVAFLTGCTDRDAAEALVHSEVAVLRSQLPPAEEGEYYWSDLIGLHVVTVNGVALGQVTQLFETGANDVLVVQGERERMIPYLPQQVVRAVDLARGEIVVDWDPDF
ncbi:MAG: ribosome maturation factor RimM [Gammaproteobacteria bacterium]|nr:ribosome maturation factor RimM [Gammaproteobacteria bacterium]